MCTPFGRLPFRSKVYADSGYQGRSFNRRCGVCRQINVGVVKRSDVGKFVVLPKR